MMRKMKQMEPFKGYLPDFAEERVGYRTGYGRKRRIRNESHGDNQEEDEAVGAGNKGVTKEVTINGT